MVASQLLSADVDAGLTFVKALDAAGFHVDAALWLFSSDTESWRFVVATPGLPEKIEQKYLEAAHVAADWRKAHPNEPILDLSRVRLVGPSDALITALRPVIHLAGLGQVRVSNNLVNGVFVEDALIHRMAA